MAEETPFDEELWAKATGDIGKPRIAICGFSNVGKSTMVNALFGTTVASVNAASGWTRKPQYIDHKLFELIDTPGWGSVKGFATEDDLEDFRRKIIEPADLVLHVLNAASGVTDDDRMLHNALKSHPGRILVINRIDLLDDKEREQTVDGVLNALGVKMGELVLTSAKLRIGLVELAHRMEERLPHAGKSAFAGALSGEEFTAEREAAATRIIHYYSVGAGLIALSPIPLSDVALLAPLQVAMFVHIGRIFGHAFTRDQAGAVVTSLLASLGARSAVQALASLIKLIPLIGTAAGMMIGPPVAAASFEALGKLVVLYFKNGQQISPDEVRSYYRRMYDEGKKKYANHNFFADIDKYKSDPLVNKGQS